MTALVIVAHGTRIAEGQQVCRALIDRVRALLPEVRVLDCYVELDEPTIEVAEPGSDRALMAAAERACAGAPGVVSILVGEAIGAVDGARRLAEMIAALAPGVETYVIPGGQEAPALLVSAR